MARFTVKGERVNDEDSDNLVWEAFESSYEADSLQDARWQARREHARGTAKAKIEKLPPNPEREQAEIDMDPAIYVDGQRTEEQQRTGDQAKEYERLITNVRILKIEKEGE
jgi:hypothetical protein